jgi:heme exporter protein D
VFSFLEMGGYGAFVWPAYGLAAAVMIGLLWTSLRNGRRQRELMDMLSSERRQRRGTPEARR